MDNRSIGVFDSGVGGLTAVKELARILPHESIVYFGDTARVPYGSHSKETIIEFAKQDLSFLLKHNVKAILIACGTVSSTSIDTLRGMSDIPIIGVIDAAAQVACCKAKQSVLVLATSATISSHAYQNRIHQLNPTVQVEEKACPLFVPLIENGFTDSHELITRLVVSEYVSEYKNRGIEAVILGCTHYPLIRKYIQEALPDAVMIEAGKEAARQMKTLLEQQDLLCSVTQDGKREYYVSEITESFVSTCELFLGGKIQGEINIHRFD